MKRRRDGLTPIGESAISSSTGSLHGPGGVLRSFGSSSHWCALEDPPRLAVSVNRDGRQNWIELIDPTTGETHGSVEGPRADGWWPHTFSTDGAWLFADAVFAEAATKELWVTDLRGMVSRSIKADESAEVAPLADGRYALLVGRSYGRMELLDLERLKPVWDKKILDELRCLAADRFAVFDGQELGVIDLKTGEEVTRLPIEGNHHPVRAWCNEAGTRFSVLCDDDKLVTLDVVSGSSRSVRLAHPFGAASPTMARSVDADVNGDRVVAIEKGIARLQTLGGTIVAEEPGCIDVVLSCDRAGPAVALHEDGVLIEMGSGVLPGPSTITEVATSRHGVLALDREGCVHPFDLRARALVG